MKKNVSTTIPARLEKAAAFTMFMPQAASVPAILENRNGRSRRHQRQFVPVPAARQRKLHGIFVQAAGHLHLAENFACRLRAQISARQAFQKALELLSGCRRERPKVGEHFVVLIDVQALVHGAQHVIGGADVELPDVLRLPGRESLRIHRFDIGIGEQAKHLQTLGRFHLFRELVNRAGIENVAAQGGAQLQVAVDQKQNRFAVEVIEVKAVEAGFRQMSTLPITWFSVFSALPVSCRSKAR